MLLRYCARHRWRPLFARVSELMTQNRRFRELTESKSPVYLPTVSGRPRPGSDGLRRGSPSGLQIGGEQRPTVATRALRQDALSSHADGSSIAATTIAHPARLRPSQGGDRGRLARIQPRLAEPCDELSSSGPRSRRTACLCSGSRRPSGHANQRMPS
jgi:hypothetical protein